MAKGRKHQPAAVKAAKGNTGRRPVVKDPAATSAPLPTVGIAAPAWLDGDALKIWNIHAPISAQLKLLTEADVNAFGRYCQNFSSWIVARKDLLKRGMTYTVKSAHGSYIRKNPSFDQMHALENDLVRLEDRFGMNPAERQRIFAVRAAGAGMGGGQLPLDGGRDNAGDKLSGNDDDQPPAGSGPVGFLN